MTRSIDIVVARPDSLDTVELKEDRGGEPPESLVPIDERVVLDDRLQERRSLRPDVRVGVLTENGGLRSSRRRSEQSDVSKGGGSPRSSTAK